MMIFGILLLLVYVAGSVNFAILILKAIGKADPRTRFSGNAGTTNVYRQAGYGWAGVVLLLDLGRAFGAAVLAMHLLTAAAVPWICFSLILGNRYPCFHGFRGGKGVAGFLGFTIPLSPVTAGLAALSWIAVYFMVRIPFIASFVMSAILAAGIMITFGRQVPAAAGALSTLLLVFFNHRQNVDALLRRQRENS